VELAVAFQTELSRQGGAGPDPALEERLSKLVARGSSAHPDLALGGVAFVRYLARCAAGTGTATPLPLEQLQVEDLYLACACAAGVAGAAARFEERCGPRLKAVLGAAVKSADLRAEIRQRVLDLLLVGTIDIPAKIIGYGGQGPIDSWTAVVAQRQLTMLLRKDETEQRAREGAALEAALSGCAAPEVAFAKHRYRHEFERAMAEALSTLEERNRLVLRLNLVSRISLEDIGKMYGVAQSTASRWLASARDQVQAEITRLLRQRLGVSPDEIASLAGVMASQIDLSISRLLGPADIHAPHRDP
jgi:RNA polymerase sigma-70 factor (ECF subfamily)